MEAKFGVDPKFDLPAKVKIEEELKSEGIKLPMKVCKRDRPSPDSADFPKRKVLKEGAGSPSAAIKDKRKIEDLKKTIDALKREFNQAQVGMNIVRNQLFKIKSWTERLEKEVNEL